MKNNFNKKVRDYIKEIYYKYESCLCKKYNPILIHNNMNVLFLKLLNDSEIAYSGNNLVKKFVCTRSIISMFRYQMYVDYYMNLNLKQKLDILTDDENTDFSKLISATTVSEIFNLSSDINSSVANNMLNTVLGFSNLSVYNKILQVKALSMEDRKKLSEVDPFIIDDFVNYDIEVTSDFIIDRMSKLNNGIYKDNNEKTYEETAAFIDSLLKLDKSDKNINMLNELVIKSDTKLDVTSDVSKDEIKIILKSAYNKSSDKSLIKK